MKRARRVGITFGCLWVVGVADAQSQRPFTIDDVFRVRTIEEQSISPGGARVAYVVREMAGANPRYSLYVAGTSGEPRDTGRVLGTGARFSNVRWRHDRAVSYVSGADGGRAITEMSIDTRDTTIAFRAPHPIAAFEWSPDGNLVAFSQTPRVMTGPRAGDPLIVPVDSSIGFSTYRAPGPEGIAAPSEIRIAHPARGIVSEPLMRISRPLIGLQWSPSGRTLAVAQWVDHIIQWSRSFFAIDEGGGPQAVATLAGVPSGAWTRDESGYVHTRTDTTKERDPDQSGVVFTDRSSFAAGARARSRRVGDLALGGTFFTGATADRLLVEMPLRAFSGLFELNIARGDLRLLTDSATHVARCTVDRVGRFASCVLEAHTVPPDIVVIDLASRTMRPITALNPWVADIRLASGREYRWVNRYGDSTVGFLYLPPVESRNASRAKPLPLLIVTYGFRNRFSHDGSVARRRCCWRRTIGGRRGWSG